MRPVRNGLAALGILAVLLLLNFSGTLGWAMNLPPERAVMLMIVIFAAVMWITEWIPLFVVSFFILFLQIMLLLPTMEAAGTPISKDVLFSPFFSNTILLFIGSFVLAALMHKYALDERVAVEVLKRVGNNPAYVLLAFMVVSGGLSMWISNTATTAMMLAMAIPLIDRMPKDHNFAKALALGIPFSCNLSGLGTPIGTPPNVIALAFLKQKGIEIAFFDWMIAMLPPLIIMVAGLWLILLWKYPCKDCSLGGEVETSRVFRAPHIMATLIFFITAIGWCTSKIHGLSSGTVALFPILACYTFRLLNINDWKALPWDIIFMIGGGMALGKGIAVSGLAQEIVAVVPSDAPMMALIALLALVAGVMTTFMSNTATANLVIPIAIALTAVVHEQILMAVVVAAMCSCAMALPISTPPNAIAFSSGRLQVKDMASTGAIISVMAFIVIYFIGVPYWSWVGLTGAPN